MDELEDFLADEVNRGLEERSAWSPTVVEYNQEYAKFANWLYRRYKADTIAEEANE